VQSPQAGLPRGRNLLSQSQLNKDVAFTDQERGALGLRGLLPWRVASIDEQVHLELEHLRRKPDDLERYIGLEALRDRNEALFYRLLVDHLEELAPIVYTPTVGRACGEFSHVVRRPYGLWVTPEDIGRIPELLRNSERPDVRLIVVTDNERILGLGDQGAGGMGIPIGKLALYTAGAGLHPDWGLPVSLDCGTDNEQLLNDPLYLGYPKPRLRGADYDAYIEAFVEAVTEVYPHAVLQWEDFKQHNAIRLLDRYRYRLASFNDDIQGTAAVVVAGIRSALRATGGRFSDQRVVVLGAGAAGIGIARLVRAAIQADVGTSGQAQGAVVLLDSQGLIYQGRGPLSPEKAAFALTGEEMQRFGFGAEGYYGLEEVVRRVSPTVLVGTCAQANAFSEEAVREMAARTEAPVVMPLSNPTANSEAVPADVLAWSEGRALVATGSPFAPVALPGGRQRVIGQANNVFVFPGIGLGTVVARARQVTDEMFLVAASALAESVSPERLATGALYPPLAELRATSRRIAVAVARQARDQGVARIRSDEEIEACTDAAMWEPAYASYVPAGCPPAG